ncbi:MAG: hypothetical protein JWQ40_3687 [Segetibacter sp.]|nr:hypothetical protein [Segetibacter sp.]
MADSSSYSHHDIRRYLQQKMSAQEMHAFERALMDDPFLADAIEGYSASDEVLAEKHLAAIEREIAGNKEKAKVVPLPSKKTTWWKVAAVAFVIVTGGALSYSIFNESDKDTNDIVATRSRESAVATDSIGPVEKPVAKNELFGNKQLLHKNEDNRVVEQKAKTGAIQEENAIASTRPVATEPEAAKPRIGAIVEGDAAVAQTMAAPPFNEPQAKSMARASAPENKEFRGQVVTNTGEPVPSASIRVRNDRIGTVTDAKGNFSFMAPDTVIKVNVNAVGFTAASTEIKTNSPANKIILDENKASLSEVVTIGYGTKTKRSNVSTVKGDTAIAAEPVGGWKNFEKYLNIQVDSLKAVEDDEFHNEIIELEFNLDKEGRPTEIEAKRTADRKMAEKAKQILLKGPKWKNEKKGKKVKVIISF